jgi:PEGA domain
MSRVRLVAATIAAVLGVALAGCSAMPDWMTPSMPDWMSSKPDGPQMQALSFESEPAGAAVRTTQGQTCMTPCAISVPSEPQSVTIEKIGFVPQTIQVSTGDPPDHSFWEHPAPTLVPNPVQVVLQAVPPPPAPPVRRHKERKSVTRAQTAAKTMQPPAGSSNPFPDPPPAQPGAAPSPDPTQPAGSPFPPPPPTQQ